jgi:WhiB family redox-sensing transcriptional regulator
MLDAACREQVADFHPAFKDDEWEAKAVCSACPVKGDCLNFALTEHIHEGIWGGLNGTERTSYKRRVARRLAVERQQQNV